LEDLFCLTGRYVDDLSVVLLASARQQLTIRMKRE